MPPYISNDLKGRIPTLHYEQGYSIKKICQLLNIKKTLAYEILKLHRKFGVPYNPHARQQGLRPRCLTTTDLSFIHALLDQQHTVYLDEIQEQLLSRRGVKVSISTLMRTLHRLHFTNKDISGKALEHNECDRAIYMNRIAELVPNPDILMFGDEASKDERTSNRCRGWSQQGTQCVQRKCFMRGKRFSILPIITLDGIIAHDIIEGSVTTENFVNFLRELVVLSQFDIPYVFTSNLEFRFPSPIPTQVCAVFLFSIIAASITLKKFDSLSEMKRVCEPFIFSYIYAYNATVCKLIFLPPYSPDYNPIEQAFSSVKAFLRRNWQDKSLGVIDRACHNITAEKAAGYFRASGYII